MNDLEKKIAELASKMTPKHAEFVEAYLHSFCASEAYTSVYGAKKNRATSDVNGSKLLRNPKVQEYLKLRFEQRRALSIVDVQFSINKCMEILKHDYVGQTVNFSQEAYEALDEKTRKLIQGVKIKHKTFRYKSGDETEEQEYEVTFMSKDKALDMLNKILGAYSQKIDLTTQGDKLSFLDIARKLEEQGKLNGTSNKSSTKQKRNQPD